MLRNADTSCSGPILTLLQLAHLSGNDTFGDFTKLDRDRVDEYLQTLRVDADSAWTFDSRLGHSSATSF